jgi:hypothetical protein
MGAFLLSDTAIEYVVTALAADSHVSREIRTSEVPFDLATSEGQCELAQAMFRLNVDAARVEGHAPLGFVSEPERASPTLAFEALCCWLAQCAEGNVHQSSKLYLMLQKIAGRMAIDMVLLSAPKGKWPSEFFYGGELQHANCPTCIEIWNRGVGAPIHDGSSLCKSGSIASGGELAHCDCAVCFGYGQSISGAVFTLRGCLLKENRMLIKELPDNIKRYLRTLLSDDISLETVENLELNELPRWLEARHREQERFIIQLNDLLYG